MNFGWLMDVGLFGLLFFLLVFVHELGHFLMAKWVGIRVEKFSIGMGPSLFSFKKGETQYILGLLPLGGYVKMLGDDPSKEFTGEEKERGFLAKSPPQKLLVVFGGPLFNLIFPIFIFGFMVISGIPTIQPIVGSLESDMPAKIAGLQAGDRILSIDGETIKKWSQVEKAVETSEGRMLNLQVERLNLKTGQAETLEVNLQPKLVDGKSKFGEDIQVYRAGVGPDFLVPLIFFESDESLLAKAGLERFDRVLRVNEIPVQTLEQLRSVWADLMPGKIDLVVLRGEKEVQKSFELPAGKVSVEERLGFEPSYLVIGHIEKNSPAERAGLKVNDLLISINKVKLREWDEVAKIVRSSEGQPVELEWNRGGKIIGASLTPEKTVIEDPLMGKDNPLARDPVYRIGVSPARMSETSLLIERSWNPKDWILRGFSETWKMTETTITALYKLVTGQLSVKLLGSPIMIYKVAGNSYRMAGGGYLGWFSFWSNLAMLSITLGLVNLLPIPVLDGGHAVFFTLEWIRGRRLSVKFMELATQLGLVLLIALFGVVLFNDFHRYGFIDSIVKFFK